MLIPNCTNQLRAIRSGDVIVGYQAVTTASNFDHCAGRIFACTDGVPGLLQNLAEQLVVDWVIINQNYSDA